MLFLSEAGKIALNIIKQQGLGAGETVLHGVGDDEKEEEVRLLINWGPITSL